MWHLPILWFCLAEDKVILGSTFWQYGFPSSVLGHFFLLGANLGLGIEWAEACTTFWIYIYIYIYIKIKGQNLVTKFVVV